MMMMILMMMMMIMMMIMMMLMVMMMMLMMIMLMVMMTISMHVDNNNNNSLWYLPCMIFTTWDVIYDDTDVYRKCYHIGMCCCGMFILSYRTSYYTINSYPPNVTYMRQRTGSALVQIMACRLFGAKPLREQLLAYCQLDSWEQISLKFESEFYHFRNTFKFVACQMAAIVCRGG